MQLLESCFQNEDLHPAYRLLHTLLNILCACEPPARTQEIFLMRTALYSYIQRIGPTVTAIGGGGAAIGGVVGVIPPGRMNFTIRLHSE